MVGGLRLSQIVEIADRLFPFEVAEPWDNCGIQIGDPERVVSSIAFSLDPTPQTVRFAAELSCELLITHHPVIVEPLRAISAQELVGRTLVEAARSRVDILALHTNFDAADGGLNDNLASALGLKEVFTPWPARCARMGKLPAAMWLFALAEKIAHDLEITSLRVVAQADHMVEQVFCASGSGMAYFSAALHRGADVIVTGDVRYHAAREAIEMGLPVIDAGHFGLEKVAVGLLMSCFQQEFARMGLEIPCHPCDLETEPFSYLTTGVTTGKEDNRLERTTSTPSKAPRDRQ
jgi:dinuclear metal center YbgI/SA1388 family protein